MVPPPCARRSTSSSATGSSRGSSSWRTRPPARIAPRRPPRRRSEATDADRGSDVGEAAEDDLEEARDLRYELTKLDRDFLRTVRIQPESG